MEKVKVRLYVARKSYSDFWDVYLEIDNKFVTGVATFWNFEELNVEENAKLFADLMNKKEPVNV